MTIPAEKGQIVRNTETGKSESLAALSADSTVLSSYLTSSSEFYDANTIPIQDTIWNPETGEFVLEFQTTKDNQAYEGLCHGGFTAMLLDSIARLPILSTKYNTEDFADELSIKYMRKVEVGATIRVTGKIDSADEKHAKISAHIVDVSKPTKVLARGHLSIDKKTQSNVPAQPEDKLEHTRGKSLRDLSKEHIMLNDYLLSSHEFYRVNNIPINDAVWNEETGELIMDVETSSLNQGEEGVCQVGYILTLLDSIAGFPVFLRSINEDKIALSNELSIRSFGKIKVGTKIRVVGKIQSIDSKKSTSSAIIINMSDASREVLAEGNLTMNII